MTSECHCKITLPNTALLTIVKQNLKFVDPDEGVRIVP